MGLRRVYFFVGFYLSVIFKLKEMEIFTYYLFADMLRTTFNQLMKKIILTASRCIIRDKHVREYAIVAPTFQFLRKIWPIMGANEE